VRGRLSPCEYVSHYYVERAGGDGLQDGAGVSDPDSDPPRSGASPAGLIQRQPAADELGNGGLGLDGQLTGSWPGRRHVPGKRQAAATEMQDLQRLPGRPGEVDDMPEPPHVLEFQVLRVIEIDVRLRRAVYQQHPRPWPVQVAEQFDSALLAVHRRHSAGVPTQHRVAGCALRRRTGHRTILCRRVVPPKCGRDHRRYGHRGNFAVACDCDCVLIGGG
jgi:hypothetical protein